MGDSTRWQAYPLLKEYMPEGNGVVSVECGAVVFHSVGVVWVWDEGLKGK